ncbi:conserved hypothetical protein (plasmid) [Rhizobium leguminosarum bv. trifolii WSM2304]|uniref:Transcriptional regulator n=1 Tax=Rhizobium leguminosarum bv. trifolii (strain WSM2304) TaxID=395492 RepID=A0ABF7QZI9_RHILW|nr:dimethylsulfonioproprionate lyase family protein [Rhizobium leguminosarum]ACI59676.1 conserved hypothetical protein [Rhizobium leguminosarum bv. trifolii WSM2304]
MQKLGGLVMRNDDPLLRDPSVEELAPARRARAGSRPHELQRVLTAFGSLLLGDAVPLMAKFNAAKIIGMLDQPGPCIIERKKFAGDRLDGVAKEALCEVRDRSKALASLADALLEILGGLEWFRGRDGTYGSVNFAQNHKHALLIGPGAIEHRTDLRIGLTILAPYTRLPDYYQSHARVFLPITRGEFRFGDEGWVASGDGDVLFNAGGRQCAIRCTSVPLINMWCHIESREPRA